MSWGRLREIRGYSIIEVLIAVSLSSVVILGVLGVATNFNIQMSDVAYKSTLNSLRAMVIQEINKPNSWKRTYRENPTFNCLLGSTTPCPDTAVGDAGGVLGGTRFDLYRDAGASAGSNLILVDFGSTTNGSMQGFTEKGVACTTALSRACPIQIILTWSFVDMGIGSLPPGDFPSGYYPASYFAALNISTGYYGYLAGVPGRIFVTGTFNVYTGTLGNGLRLFKVKNTDLNFSIVKEVP